MKVRIYRPSKSAMQSGLGKTGTWVLEYETVSKRQPEALMGWTCSEDTLNQVQMRFESKEQAIAFAKKKGWTYNVAADHIRRVQPRNYADKFKYIPPEE